MNPRETYHNADARLTPLWSPLEQYARENDAQVGSMLLLEASSRLAPESTEPRRLTFAEQLALVESGKARVIPVIPIRKMDPEFTLGGVQPWQ